MLARVRLPERCEKCGKATPAYTGASVREWCNDHIRRDEATVGMLNDAKEAAHVAYVAAKRTLDGLDETAPNVIVRLAEEAVTQSWNLYNELVLETEW